MYCQTTYKLRNYNELVKLTYDELVSVYLAMEEFV